MKRRTATNKAKKSLCRQQVGGFTMLQLLITVALVTIITAFGVVTITKARAALRLTNSARLLAGYIEQARSDAIRRHGFSTVEVLNTGFPLNSYRITMDFDGNSITESRDFNLEEGVRFTTPPGSITFDWRGRIAREASLGMVLMSDETRTSNVAITGSGDVTLDSLVFQDSAIPAVVLNNGSVGGDVARDPYPSPQTSPSPNSSPSPTPSPDAEPSPTPTPDASASPTPQPSPDASPSPTATPYPSPQSSPSPTPTPITGPCAISVDPNPLGVIKNGSGGAFVTIRNFSGNVTITAKPGNSGVIQVSPTSKTVTATSDGTGRATFVVTVKSQNGDVLFSSPCGSTTLNIVVR